MLNAALLLLSVQLASPTAGAVQPGYGPAAPKPAPAAAPAPAEPSCRNMMPTEPGEIIVCAERPKGYRIDPDLMEAQRAIREHRKPRGAERFVDKSCATVGPMGCRGSATVDLLAVAATAATMAKRLSQGKEVGSMFVTDPQPTEYELYRQLKQQREEREAIAAAEALRAQSVPSGQ